MDIDKHYHFIGIGGIGMSGIALILLQNGVKVSGSDLKENKNINELRKLGADVFIGHNALNVKGADLVVFSSAIKENNPEIVETKRLGIPLIKRAEALLSLMDDKIVITAAGSHGKTTTASLVSCLLFEAGFSPTAAIGGIVRNINTNAYSGDGKFFVAEADESDGSFLYYRPKFSIITNIDHEHLDYYKDFNNEVEAFKLFMNGTEKDGCIFCCGDDLNLKNALNGYKNRYVLFGLKDEFHIYAKNIRINGLSSEFDCFYNDKFSRPLRAKAGFLERFFLPLGGRHNISNSLSVIALGLELGIDLKVIKAALSNYRGAVRRIEIKFKNEDYLVIDDYAHHPTEIKATLQAVKNIQPNRLIAVFQPHRYTRTKLLLDDFGKSFNDADYIIITDIYAASEMPLEGITGECIYKKIKEYFPEKSADYLPRGELVSYLLKMIKPGNLIITLGAGDITKISDELAEKLKRQG